jgi:hypothetical protein
MSYHFSKIVSVPFDEAIENPALGGVARQVQGLLKGTIENL